MSKYELVSYGIFFGIIGIGVFILAVIPLLVFFYTKVKAYLADNTDDKSEHPRCKKCGTNLDRRHLYIEYGRCINLKYNEDKDMLQITCPICYYINYMEPVVKG